MNRKYDPDQLKSVIIGWDEPCYDAIPENKREAFKDRVKAIKMYSNGFSNTEIEKETGISSTHISRIISYCFDNIEKEYLSLLPNKNNRKSEFNPDSNGNAGKFTLLLHEFPELEALLIGNYVCDKKYTLEKVMTISAIHRKFLERCRELGLGDDDYPFNTKSMAKASVKRFLDDYSKKNNKAVISRISKDAKQILNSTGYGDKYTRNPVIPFSAVQVDGHILDLIYTTEVILDDGTIENYECSRCWVFAVIDVATRCVIGYSMSQELNYNQNDVLKAIQNSLLPHETRDMKVQTLSMPKNGGFPSTAYPELKNAMFDTIMLDNAKSHLAYNVVDKLVNDLKCTVNFGAVSTPETRSIIERFFGSLESRGIHRTPITTGSNKSDVKRQSPEKAAKKYSVTYDEVCDLVEALIAEYNNSPHSSLMNRSPLEELGKKIENGMLPYIAFQEEIEEIKRIMYQTKTVTVRGNKDNGKRPYITFMNAQYRNDKLSSNYMLLGEKITIRYNPEDISSVTGYLSNGSSIGELKAVGEFGRKSHSIKSRKIINKLAKENEKEYTNFSTPISDFEQHLKDKAQNNKALRTRSDILRRELGKKELHEQVQETGKIIKFESENTQDYRTLEIDDILNMSDKDLLNIMINKGGQKNA